MVSGGTRHRIPARPHGPGPSERCQPTGRAPAPEAPPGVFVSQEIDLTRELAAAAACGERRIPDEAELWGLAPDLDSCPPDDVGVWLTGLPPDPLDEDTRTGSDAADAVGAEIFPAGYEDRERGDGAGFAAGGVADSLPPGAALAGLADRAWQGGLGGLSDDELVGVALAWRRMAAHAAAGQFAVIAELSARREAHARRTGNPDLAAHLDDEIAAAFTLTARGADRLLELAHGLRRLPATMAALSVGAIDERRAAIIADETSPLDEGHAADVERHLLRRASGQTTGQLRAAARRAVIAADPAAALRRKQEAQREARVERWGEHAGTAALAGRDLPPAEVLAADQNLTALACQLKAAGVEATMDQLRARAYLALLAGQPVTAAGLNLRGDGASFRDSTPAGLGVPGETPAPGGPPPPGFANSGPVGSCGLRGSVHLTMPLATWLGLSDSPGQAAGHGPLDADDSRRLAAALATHTGNRWCLTLTGPTGASRAHGCARTPPPACPGRPPPPGEPAPPGSTAPPGGTTEPWTITLQAIEASECAHTRQTPAYQPTPALRHIIQIRQATCAFPGCRRPAERCDHDHTIPYDHGGRTCECGLAPLCRTHHRAKQTPGWRLDQPHPGTMIWTLPSGRVYTTTPTRYPD